MTTPGGPATPTGVQPIEKDEAAIPKAEWQARVLKSHPDVLEVRERIRPLIITPGKPGPAPSFWT